MAGGTGGTSTATDRRRQLDPLGQRGLDGGRERSPPPPCARSGQGRSRSLFMRRLNGCFRPQDRIFLHPLGKDGSASSEVPLLQGNAQGQEMEAEGPRAQRQPVLLEPGEWNMRMDGGISVGRAPVPDARVKVGHVGRFTPAVWQNVGMAGDGPACDRGKFPSRIFCMPSNGNLKMSPVLPADCRRRFRACGLARVIPGQPGSRCPPPYERQPPSSHRASPCSYRRKWPQLF